mgnify:CR=1 FL=1
MNEIPTGPIPGENYTSDQRNYPWHRPPEFTDMDSALKMISKRLFHKETSRGLLTMMEMGVPITALTSAFVLSGIGGGKWTPDYALLLAGPVSHMMVLLAKSEEIDYNLGIEEKIPPPSSAFFKEVEKDNAKIRALGDILPEVEKKSDAVVEQEGFMAMARNLASQVEDTSVEQSPEQPIPEGVM